MSAAKDGGTGKRGHADSPLESTRYSSSNKKPRVSSSKSANRLAYGSAGPDFSLPPMGQLLSDEEAEEGTDVPLGVSGVKYTFATDVENRITYYRSGNGAEMQLMMGLLSVERRLVQKRAMHIEELPGQSVVPVGLSSPFKGAVKLEDVLVAFVFSWKWKNDGQSYERVFLVPQDRVLDKAAYECPKKSAGDDGNVCILPTERDK